MTLRLQIYPIKTVTTAQNHNFQWLYCQETSHFCKKSEVVRIGVNFFFYLLIVRRELVKLIVRSDRYILFNSQRSQAETINLRLTSQNKFTKPAIGHCQPKQTSCTSGSTITSGIIGSHGVNQPINESILAMFSYTDKLEIGKLAQCCHWWLTGSWNWNKTLIGIFADFTAGHHARLEAIVLQGTSR